MAAIPTQVIALPNLLPTFQAAAGGGDTFTPGDRTFMVVKNASGISITANFETKPDTTITGEAIPNHSQAIAAGTERWFGPLIGSYYGDSSGVGSISWPAGVASVTVGVFKI